MGHGRHKTSSDLTEAEFDAGMLDADDPGMVRRLEFMNNFLQA